MKVIKFFRYCCNMLIILILFHTGLIAQNSELDSLFYSMNLKTFDGTITMLCAEQCEERGLSSQSMLECLVSSYPDSIRNLFQLKLAVLDSSRWSELGVPYGFSFISTGWIIIPGDLDFKKYSRLWGFQEFKDVVESNLSELSIEPQKLLSDAIYGFVICHELGHYYTKNILHASTYDRWTKEWFASYFATDFLHKFDRELLEAYSVFTSSFINKFNPQYRKLSDFNEKYAGVGLKNYIWYHCMFGQMIEDLYSSYGTGFIDKFAKAFPDKQDKKELNHDEYLQMLDKLTEGKATKWIKIMEQD